MRELSGSASGTGDPMVEEGEQVGKVTLEGWGDLADRVEPFSEGVVLPLPRCASPSHNDSCGLLPSHSEEVASMSIIKTSLNRCVAGDGGAGTEASGGWN
jgi:hypothetical protein